MIDVDLLVLDRCSSDIDQMSESERERLVMFMGGKTALSLFEIMLKHYELIIRQGTTEDLERVRTRLKYLAERV